MFLALSLIFFSCIYSLLFGLMHWVPQVQILDECKECMTNILTLILSLVVGRFQETSYISSSNNSEFPWTSPKSSTSRRGLNYLWSSKTFKSLAKSKLWKCIEAPNKACFILESSICRVFQKHHLTLEVDIKWRWTPLLNLMQKEWQLAVLRPGSDSDESRKVWISQYLHPPPL